VYTTVYTTLYTAVYMAVYTVVYTAVYTGRVLLYGSCTRPAKQLSNRLMVIGNRNNIEIFLYI